MADKEKNIQSIYELIKSLGLTVTDVQKAMLLMSNDIPETGTGNPFGAVNEAGIQAVLDAIKRLDMDIVDIQKILEAMETEDGQKILDAIRLGMIPPDLNKKGD